MPYTDITFADLLTSTQMNNLIANFLSTKEMFNFGFTTTIDTPASGDIQIDFKQGDNSTDPSSTNPTIIGFAGLSDALKLSAAKSLKIDKTDHFELDTYSINTETFLFIYAIDRGGTLEFGVGRRHDYTRATSNFVNTEGTAITRNHVFCTAAITSGDRCRVVGYFKATYNTTTPDWESITADSDEIGESPSPHPRTMAAAWCIYDGATGPAIKKSHNIAAVVDGAGDYIFTFDTDMESSDYAAFASASRVSAVNPLICAVFSYAVGSVHVSVHRHSTGVEEDTNNVAFLAFGDSA